MRRLPPDSAAAEAECRLLLSEDLQNGFTWRGVTVVNPSQEPVHPLLQALLSPPNVPTARPGGKPAR